MSINNSGLYLILSNNDDFRSGSSRNDDIFALAGNDRILGLGGNDYIDGGIGKDLLDGGSGIDWVYGGEDNDIIFGGSNDDFLVGGDGDDVIFGDDGTSPIYFENYPEISSRLDVEDELYPRVESDDKIYGGSGNDLIFGEIGRDLLNGQKGNDSLDGGVGGDTLYGGQGNDYLIGNDGWDILVGVDIRDTNPGQGEIDQLFSDSPIGSFGTEKDTFVLGISGKVFYDDQNLDNLGNEDYGDILDFNKNDDTIQLSGKPEDYILSEYQGGTRIYLKGYLEIISKTITYGGTSYQYFTTIKHQDEMIGYIHNLTPRTWFSPNGDIDLYSNQFSYV